MTTSTPTSTSAPASTVTSRSIVIDGMSGDECVKKVAAAIKTVPSVTSSNVSVGSATISADAAGCKSACEAIGRAGFKSHEANKGAPAHAPAKANATPITPANTNAPASSNTNAPAPSNTPVNTSSGDDAMRAGTPANTHNPVKPGADKSSYNNVARPGNGACTSSTVETKPDAMKANADCCTDAGKTGACVKPEAVKA